MGNQVQHKNVIVTFNIGGCQTDAELSHGETLALAQFFKRLTWSELRGCAESDEEAYLIRSAVSKLQDAMARGGYAPR
ncbi:DUF7706 family protein [Pseudomonas sp. CNPSo 3701]|uniref:DUF7706 family protein n=1 Tax=Pseudomonas sp. CNPSo 3701 TaxID=3027943 RepID=UPI0023634B52|nr:hypothetical protein [Pseudomonas sp. CNPSo 3701]MDD1507726.1 hypothetical protein [Pseudomonas sp. CNPSo 3701]